MLKATDLHRSFGGIAAVAGVSIEIAQRETLCVIGPNGAGKSTLLNLLCGTTRADCGRILLDGHDLTKAPAFRFARSGIARKFQAPAIFAGMSVVENLRIAGEAGGRSLQEAEVDRILETVSLQNEPACPAGELSHGNKQWLEIGMCLMARPKLLLLDEPTAGMTSDETMKTVALLRSLADGLAVVAVEHDMAFVREMRVRTCVMHQGKLVRDGAFSDIERDEFVKEIYLGA